MEHFVFWCNDEHIEKVREKVKALNVSCGTTC